MQLPTARVFRVAFFRASLPALGLGAVLALAGPLPAQEGAHPTDAASRDAKVQERLLHAQRGGVLRATSRYRDDHWEYKDGDG
jgi:hypothetical protein